MLKDFAEVPLPEAVSLWPATAAWLWPLGLAVLLLVTGSAKLWRWWRRNRYRREALARLARLNREEALLQLPSLLKATALRAYGRPAVAALHGEAWLGFLSAQCPGTNFDGETGQALLEIDYLPRPQWRHGTTHQEALLSSAITWIRRHRSPHSPHTPLAPH
jgi:hypothetical protein